MEVGMERGPQEDHKNGIGILRELSSDGVLP